MAYENPNDRFIARLRRSNPRRTSKFKLASCVGKSRYSSMRRANAGARRTEQRINLPMKAYFCHYCHRYHIAKL